MKKKLIAIVMGLLVSTSAFATGKMGAGLGYVAFGQKEGVFTDLVGCFLNSLFPSQPIAMLAGSWGADVLPPSKTMGCGLGYQIFSDKKPSKGNQILGWWVNAVVFPSQPIAMISGSWGGDDPDYAVSGKVNVSLAE